MRIKSSKIWPSLLLSKNCVAMSIIGLPSLLFYLVNKSVNPSAFKLDLIFSLPMAASTIGATKLKTFATVLASMFNFLANLSSVASVFEPKICPRILRPSSLALSLPPNKTPIESSNDPSCFDSSASDNWLDPFLTKQL